MVQEYKCQVKTNSGFNGLNRFTNEVLRMFKSCCDTYLYLVKSLYSTLAITNLSLICCPIITNFYRLFVSYSSNDNITVKVFTNVSKCKWCNCCKFFTTLKSVVKMIRWGKGDSEKYCNLK